MMTDFAQLLIQDWPTYTFLAALIFAGSTLQGTIGFGLGTIATPLIALLKPELVPTVVLILALIIASSTLARTWRETDWQLVVISSLFRLPGTLLAAWALTVLSADALGLFIGIAVLCAMGLSSLGWTPKINLATTGIAGFTSGFLGTSTSVGGPPMALLMKSYTPTKVRGTLSATFVIGSCISLTSLGISGQITQHQALVAVTFAPLAILGIAIAQKLLPYVDQKRLNRIVTVVAVSASILLILESTVLDAL